MSSNNNMSSNKEQCEKLLSDLKVTYENNCIYRTDDSTLALIILKQLNVNRLIFNCKLIIYNETMYKIMIDIPTEMVFNQSLSTLDEIIKWSNSLYDCNRTYIDMVNLIKNTIQMYRTDTNKHVHKNV